MLISDIIEERDVFNRNQKEYSSFLNRQIFLPADYLRKNIVRRVSKLSQTNLTMHAKVVLIRI